MLSFFFTVSYRGDATEFWSYALKNHSHFKAVYMQQAKLSFSRFHLLSGSEFLTIELINVTLYSNQLCHQLMIIPQQQ